MKIIYIFGIVIILTADLMGSSEGALPCRVSKIEIVATEIDFSIFFELDDKNILTQLVSRWKKKSCTFTKKHFGELAGVQLNNIIIHTPNDIAGGHQESQIVIIPYNIHFSKSVGNEPVKQWNIIRLHFNKGKLELWEKAEGNPEHSGQWKLSSWGEAEGDQINDKDEVEGVILNQGVVFGAENPFSRSLNKKSYPH